MMSASLYLTMTREGFHFLTDVEQLDQLFVVLIIYSPITSFLVGSDVLIRKWVLNHLLLDACTQGRWR